MLHMNINYNKSSRTVIISGTYSTSTAPVFNESGDTYGLTFINLKNIKYFNSFIYETSGEKEYRYITTQYRLSKDGDMWSDWFVLDNSVSGFPPFDPKYDMFFEIKWVREGDSDIGEIKLLRYELYGVYDGDVVVSDFAGKIKIYDNFHIYHEIIYKPFTINISS